MTGTKCYGLTDENGRPLPDSPPLTELPSTGITPDTRTVLYNPRHPTFLKDIRLLRLVRIKK